VQDIKDTVSKNVTNQIQDASRIDLKRLTNISDSTQKIWERTRLQGNEIEKTLDRATTMGRRVSAIESLQGRLEKSQRLLDSLQKWIDHGQLFLAAPSR
jgi:hypothetical protein